MPKTLTLSLRKSAGSLVGKSSFDKPGTITLYDNHMSSAETKHYELEGAIAGHNVQDIPGRVIVQRPWIAMSQSTRVYCSITRRVTWYVCGMNGWAGLDVH
ncbi:hypothetical protein HETIRDRAFT_322514 [Heterobasidion irregulare TC 32-1]|uniref:Uncharacterized protein n=1 Tax=Heterobasidion irregulare (strain TC 32-1) TaxID=747525 RepID=W4K2W2_HETIT|nr:uncharacterized protein HETIRDRAFT_322514 [Heterobasidion irregulare TC 32-1]ETW80163.1 hypothetical protein HETIRDRAFT_322514 [Heterobasidion irregulare TC 32-1]